MLNLPRIIFELCAPWLGLTVIQVARTSEGIVTRLLLERSRYVKDLMYFAASAGTEESLLLCKSRSFRLGIYFKDSQGKAVREFPSSLSSSRLFNPRKLSTFTDDNTLKDSHKNSRLERSLNASLGILFIAVFSILSLDVSLGMLAGTRKISGSLQITLLDK